MVKVYVDGKDNTSIAFPQGNNLEKEVAFLMWWATGQGRVPAYGLYHRAPKRVEVFCPMIGTLIGIKQKDGRLFEVYI